MHLDQVADVVHEAEHAHGEETDCVEGEERSDDELLCADVFEKTEDAVDPDTQFDDCLPRELLSVVALGLLLGSAALRGADEAALGTDHSGEHRAGVADRDTHAKSHEDGEAEQADLPAGVAGAALCNEVKNGRSDSGEEDKAETDGVAPVRDVRDRIEECEQRPGAECGKEHAGVDGVVRRVEDGANLYAERNLGLEHARQNLDGRLDGALGPAELLCLERVDVVGEFGRHNHVEHELHLPTGELRTVRKVHVFGQRVAFPAATAVDGLLAPHACGTVEVHEQLAPATGGLFHHEVSVDTDGLGECKTGFRAVQVAPAALDQANLVVHHQVGDGLEEEVLLGHEVRVEDGEEVALRDGHGFLEGAGLVFGTVRAVDKLDVVALGGKFFDLLLGDFVAFVGGVVQNLDFVLVLGVVDSAHGLEEAFDAVGFVKDGELGRDLRELVDGMLAIELENILAVGKSRVAAVLQEQVYAVVATKTVNHQSYTGDDIDYEHCVEKESIHRFKNLCTIECLRPNIETVGLLCHISLLFFM